MRIDPSEVVIADGRIDPNEVEIATAKPQPDSFLSRVGTGLFDPVVGAAQIADKVLVNPIRQRLSPGASSMADVIKQRDAEYNAPEGFDAARLVGNVANPVSWAGGGTPGLTRAGAAAAHGAFQAGLAPVNPDKNFAEQKVEQAGIGAVAGRVLSKALGGLVAPTAEAKTLMDAGVTLTPGQAAGKGSFTKWAEEGLGSLPVASHFIKSAQGRAVEDANVAAAQTVANMVSNDVKLGRPPREAIEQTRELVGKHYDEALAGIKADPMTILKGLEGGYEGIIAGNPMTTRKGFMHLQDSVTNRLQHLADQGFVLDGPALKQIDSELGSHIRHLRSSTSAEEKANAGAWMDMQQNLRELLATMMPAEQSAKLNAANAAYRQLLTLEKAMAPGAETFTPRRLAASLDRASVDSGELRNISNAMSATLPNQMPSSGTAERLLMGAMPALLMGGGAGANSMGFDTLGTGMMAAGALGSRPGSRLLTGRNVVQKALSPHDAQIAASVAAALRGQGQKRD